MQRFLFFFGVEPLVLKERGSNNLEFGLKQCLAKNCFLRESNLGSFE